MKLVKSLLLGSAAGLFAVAGAQAADLPVRKAAPVAVEYVRVCSAYGAGFFFIPGTETCLRISGRVRAEVRYEETELRSDNAIGWRARGRLNLDARTATAYGTLRTFIRFENTYNSGNYSGGPGAGVGGLAGGETGTLLNKGFIQFAGITAGRATSFFDFYANDLNWGGLPTGSDTYGNDPVVFAYTATFAPGLTATLSAEDPRARRTVAGVTGFYGPLLPGGVAVPANALDYAGQRMPEIVANVRYDAAFGSFQLSGAVHQLNGLDRSVPAIVNGVYVGNTGPFVDTEYGFAVSAGAKFNLPFIAPGDVLWLQATYADGAVNYLGFGNRFQLGRTDLNVGDAFIDGTGNVRKTEGFNFTAAFLHYWTPQVRQAVFGTYGYIDVPTSVTSAFISTVPGTPGFGVFAASNTIRDVEYWQIGTNLIWSPVRDLDIGVEVLYRNVEGQGRNLDRTFLAVTAPGNVAVLAPTTTRTVRDSDAFEARLRIQRDF